MVEIRQIVEDLMLPKATLYIQRGSLDCTDDTRASVTRQSRGYRNLCIYERMTAMELELTSCIRLLALDDI